jgi:hypothetical protein
MQPLSKPQIVRIASGFECSMRHPIEAQGGSGATNDPARFVLRFPKGREQSGFFMFALEGVAGKTVQVTIQSDRAGNWTTLNPVFAYVDEQSAAGQTRKHSPVDELLANLDLFRVSPSARTNKQDLVKTANGALLPDTRGQAWSFIEQCSADPKKKTFSLRQTFDAAKGNRVVIAMRYPYTPKLCDAMMRALQQRWEKERQLFQKLPDWGVEEIGKSQGGRPLWVVRIGALGRTPAEQLSKRCVLFYAREHGDEHDSSWVAQGVINYLLGKDPPAVELRKRMIVLAIPLLDPDCAAVNEYEHIIRSFHPNIPTPESNLYAGFFQRWVNAGHRLDITFNLHNVESKEGPHVFPFQFEGRPERWPHAVLATARWD